MGLYAFYIYKCGFPPFTKTFGTGFGNQRPKRAWGYVIFELRIMTTIILLYSFGRYVRIIVTNEHRYLTSLLHPKHLLCQHFDSRRQHDPNEIPIRFSRSRFDFDYSYRHAKMQQVAIKALITMYIFITICNRSKLNQQEIQSLMLLIRTNGATIRLQVIWTKVWSTQIIKITINY